MRVQTGQGTIPLMTLIAIWSISAITSLPGLAVSPILGDLDKIFPHVSDLEIQMLTSLPSLLIIPFVLLSGKLSESKDKTTILMIGLAIFLTSGILYFFAKSMLELILISCLLGVGAGMVIPLSTGLIADFFVGEYRTKQLGFSSSITNLTLVLATFLTGWLANYNWHYPFVVYLIPAAALLLSYYLKDSTLAKNNVHYIGQEEKNKKQPAKPIVESPLLKPGEAINKKALAGLMIVYFLATYLVLVVSFNLPFVIQDYKLNSSYSGSMISLFFLAMMLPGLFIDKIIKILQNKVLAFSFAEIAIGLFLIVIFKSIFIIALGVFMVGSGYGIMQPLIYDKTTLTARHDKAVLALAFVMSTNYLAILLCPFIVDAFQFILDQHNELFPFILNGIISIAIAVLAYMKRHSTVFSASSSIK
ncbi:MAG: MFS transporter [Tannerellaceae bacterium]